MNISMEDVRKTAVEVARTIVEETSEKVAKEAAERAAKLHRETTKELVSETVIQTLIQLGISTNNPLEMQADMKHLRDWRKSTEIIKSRTILVSVSLLLSGIVGAVFLGIKEILTK